METIEIVTFRLKEGVSVADFVDANRDVDAWLRRQPGFRSRRIGEQRGHSIVDMLLWDSAITARTAMLKLMDELPDSPVHALIDQETVSWSLSSVRHKRCRDG